MIHVDLIFLLTTGALETKLYSKGHAGVRAIPALKEGMQPSLFPLRRRP